MILSLVKSPVSKLTIDAFKAVSLFTSHAFAKAGVGAGAGAGAGAGTCTTGASDACGCPVGVTDELWSFFL